jgi:ABC-type oligopeptide transport system ATPase subunit
MSVRAQVLDLIGRLREREGLSVLFISHDLGVVQRIAERTIVLHRGRVVEQGLTDRVLGSPQKDYTKSLVAAVPETLVPWRDRVRRQL